MEGRRLRRARVRLEYLHSEEPPREITTQFARLADNECRIRAKPTKMARLEDAKDYIARACALGMGRSRCTSWPCAG